MNLLLLPAVLALALSGCITQEVDVEETEAQAEQATAAAYDRADEVAMKAQNQADETATKAESDADATIETAQEDADRTADAAYSKAEHVEASAGNKVAAAEQAQFVQAMRKELEGRRSWIRTMGPTGDKVAAEGAAKATAAALSEVEHAQPAAWTQHRQKVEASLANFDRTYGPEILP